jgi:hypothetical protein
MRKPVLHLNNPLLTICVMGLALPLSACNEQETAAAEQTFGPSPALPAPESSLLPTVNVAKAIGWPEEIGRASCRERVLSCV